MKRNKSNRLIAILCSIVLMAEQIWGSGLYVSAAGETDAQAVSESQQDQADETEAAAPASDDTTAPVTDQDNEKKKEEAAPTDEKNEDAVTTDSAEDVEIEADKEETVTEDRGNDPVEPDTGVVPNIGTYHKDTHTLVIGEGENKTVIVRIPGDYLDFVEVITADPSAAVSTIPSAFAFGAKELKTVDFSQLDATKPLSEIGVQAFCACPKLETVNLGGANSVEPLAFYGCSKITSVDLSNITSVGDMAFAGCSKLEEITLNKNLSCEDRPYYTGIRGYQSCFAGCNLKVINFAAGMDVVPPMLFRAIVDDAQEVEGFVAQGKKVFADDAVITLPAQVTGIGLHAFENSNIKKLLIEGELTGISDQAFYHCESLTELRSSTDAEGVGKIKFPGKTQNIGISAFEGCTAITEIVIPDTVTRIYNRAFYGCTGLVSLTLSKGTTRETTGSEVFRYCTNLASLTIPDGLKAIGEMEFYECYKLENLTFEGLDETTYKGTSLEYIGNKAFATENDQVANLDPTVANKLTSVLLPDSVTYLGDGAFANCIQLLTIHIPQNLTGIGADTFRNCIVLTTADLPETIEVIGDNAFCKCLKLVLNNEPVHLTKKNQLPAMLTVIGANAFNQCEQFPYITIPDKVEQIGAGAFVRCINATAITIKSKVLKSCTGIGIFDNCKSVGSVTFPEGMTEIPANLFWGADLNPNTCHIVIPKTVTVIGENAFAGENETTGWATLTHISFEEGSVLERIASNAFRFNSTMEEIILPEGLKRIEDGAFSWTSNLKGIIIPESVEFIGRNAFARGERLNDVEIKAIEFTTNVNEGNSDDLSLFIGEGIFYLSRVKNIKIGEKVRSFPDYLFMGAEFKKADQLQEADLVTLTIPKDVTRLGDYCLSNVVNLKEIKIEEGSELERIGQNAFYSCKNLRNINIPDSVTEIGQYAFSDCTKLGADCEGEFKLPTKLETLGKGAFLNCSSLGLDVTLPAGLKKINDEIFKECVRLRSVSFLCAVTAIGSSAFEGCVALTQVTIPYGVTSIGAAAFKGCSGLVKVVVPNTVTAIGAGAFEGCNNAVFYVSSGTDAEKLLKAANIPEDRIHVYSYKITYELYEGINAPDNPSGFDSTDLPIALKDPVREGSTFLGWYTSDDFTNKIEIIQNVQQDLHLYAKWVNTEYTITYVLRGGVNNPENPATYTMWDEDIVLKDPVLTGISFGGWFTDLKDETTKVEVIKKGTKGDITLYAQWYGNSAEMPKANLQSGTKVKAGVKLRLYCTTPGAVIYYSTSETDAIPASPEPIPANEYNGGIVINKKIKIRAIAIAEGYLESAPADFEYDLISESSYWGDVIDEADQTEVGKPENVPNKIWIAGVPDSVDYTGEAIIFNNLRVYDHKTLLTEGVDYTISYKNNKKVADKNASPSKAPSVVVKGKGSYNGKYVKTFTIKEGNSVSLFTGTIAIKKSDVILENQNVTYDPLGLTAAAIGLKVSSGGKELIENTDYIAVFSKNKAGKATVTVKGAGNYRGKVKKKFTVKAADISNATIMFVDDSGNVVSTNKIDAEGNVVDKTAADYIYGYQKGGAKPGIQVFIGNKRLIKGVDYTVSYEGNTPGNNDGGVTASLTITGAGNYSGTKSAQYTVLKGNMSDISLAASGIKYSAKGVSAKNMKLVVLDTNGNMLSKTDESGNPLDYTVKYTYVQGGETKELTDEKVILAQDTQITVTITGANNYNGTLSTTTTVYTAAIDKAKVKVPSQMYTGNAIEPGYDVVSVTYKGSPLAKKDYRIVGYSSNIKGGNGKIYLVGSGSYGGLKTAKFKITKKKMSN